MSATAVFYIILVFLVLEFLVERILDRLNMRHMSADLPESLRGIYDAQEYSRFQSYKRENNRFGLISSTFSFVVMIGFLGSGGLGWYNSWIVSYTEQVLWQTLLFMGGLVLVSEIIGLPFAWYATFRIEEKYGFNKMTMKTFFSDAVKRL